MLNAFFEEVFILLGRSAVKSREHGMARLLYARKVRSEVSASSHETVMHAKRITTAAVMAVIHANGINGLEVASVINTLVFKVCGTARIFIEVMRVSKIPLVVEFLRASALQNPFFQKGSRSFLFYCEFLDRH